MNAGLLSGSEDPTGAPALGPASSPVPSLAVVRLLPEARNAGTQA